MNMYFIKSFLMILFYLILLHLLFYFQLNDIAKQKNKIKMIITPKFSILSYQKKQKNKVG